MTDRLIASVAAATLLAACASQTWEKPAATADDFTEARYTCLKQSQQHVGSASNIQSSRVVTNASLFDACMTSQGWNAQQHIPPDQRTKLKEVVDRFAPQFKDLCARPDLQAHFRKSPCDAEDPSFEQLADGSRISEPEKLALSKLITAVRSLNGQMTGEMRQASPEYAPAVIRQREALLALFEKGSLDFYEGRTTRGEYNKARKDVALRSRNWSVR